MTSAVKLRTLTVSRDELKTLSRTRHYDPSTPTPEQRARTGSREGLVRIAVDIADADDIIVAPDQASAAS